MEQIVGILKQAEVGVPVRQLKQCQEENARRKWLVADLTLDKTLLQDVLANNSEASATPPSGRVPARGPRPERPNQVWSYDLVSGRTEEGRRLRILTRMDEHRRECLALPEERRMGRRRVFETLSYVMLWRGLTGDHSGGVLAMEPAR